jgi:DNA-binding SARP family transcriptional activator
MDIDIKLLGTLEVSVDGVSIVPSAAKPRQLLAMLALNAQHYVSVSTLKTEMWGHVPPRTSTTVLHTYIGKLRRALSHALRNGSAAEAKYVLATERIGYRLVVPHESVDAFRYEQIAGAGRRAAEKGDYLSAARSLDKALALWGGPALSDVVAGPFLSAELVRLEEIHLSDLDTRMEAELRLGRHRQLLGELAGLCARFPDSENFSAKYMLALYRSGHQGRALEVFQRLRGTMAEELGVDPSANIRRLHLAVLRGDPAVENPNFYTNDWASRALAR